ncbi:Beta-ketoadipate enol-lactone hydrolase [Streptococcus gordonii]|uniref:Beta-ketoadipate enol-lactone hydrolase n=1 Tax=Streptococcus gordonii TaxID=1302 RepID=A0A139N872_STRGN|nr:Beta-ketoadipate enol-lactone hydrolase [Streptococcus gordonii]
MVAALAPDTVRGLLIEDAPFFSIEPSRAPSTFSWLGFKDMYDFLKSGKKIILPIF